MNQNMSQIYVLRLKYFSEKLGSAQILLRQSEQKNCATMPQQALAQKKGGLWKCSSFRPTWFPDVRSSAVWYSPFETSREFHFIPTPELRLVFKLGGSCELVIKVRGKVWLAAHRSLLQALAVLRSCSRVSSLAMDTKAYRIESLLLYQMEK